MRSRFWFRLMIIAVSVVCACFDSVLDPWNWKFNSFDLRNERNLIRILWFDLFISRNRKTLISFCYSGFFLVFVLMIVARFLPFFSKLGNRVVGILSSIFLHSCLFVTFLALLLVGVAYLSVEMFSWCYRIVYWNLSLVDWI